ncbi:MAG TPA: DUF5107 domain-containing protein [Jiangellales bacterium]|nr:DUF5107 domain-containing protein [Jiangellales bacterium]
MASLTLGTIRTPCSPLGPTNPLPPLLDAAEIHTGATSADVPPDVVARLRYGHMRSVFPYLRQDGYSRERTESDLRVAVLDNGLVRAMLLLDLGGRLWSLMDLRTGRELLHQGNALQFANLALRNAWFAGGVEWNIGTTGHTPGTADPLHAARVITASGDPVLRMYEWDRLRDTVYQVDAWLEDGHDRLYVYVRIVNPNDHAVPMYWWSNTAVPQAPGVRVIAPAASAYHFGYERSLEVVPVPGHGGRDCTYPTGHRFAADYFFRIEDGQQPWIAAVDADGSGLLQTSTSRLRGRKLFVWGTGTGGRHWQEWLGGDPQYGYLEIQAGLASTQMEHVQMPAGARWSWVESYGPLTVNAARAHDPDWEVARRTVQEHVEQKAPAYGLEQRLRAADARADQPPVETLHVGSGWGALELRHRNLAGLTGTPFPRSTLGPEQAPWVTLIDTGSLPSSPVGQPPPSYVSGERWRRRLAATPATWQTELHLGHIAHVDGDLSGAERHYENSLTIERSPWALRALALIRAERGDHAAAARMLEDAVERAPDVLPLALELGDALLAADRPADALTVVDRLGNQPDDHGRVGLLAATAALACRQLDRAAALLDAPLQVADVREGEVALDRLWVTFRMLLGDDEATATASIPYHYDFRMKPAAHG